VETAFAFRISALDRKSPGAAPPASSTEVAKTNTAREESVSSPAVTEVHQQSPRHIDKSVLAVPEVRRYRDKEHLKFVASKSCLICGRKPAEPHHLRFAQKPALGRKVSDEFAVPLCRLHHRELHRSPDETQWWQTARIDPLKVARALWKASRSPQDRGADVVPDASSPSSPAENPQPSTETPEKVARSVVPVASAPDSPAGIGK
jgi:hypothetical protein